MALQLLIDLGNTALKWAVLRDAQLGAVAYRPHAGQDAARLFDALWTTQPPPAAVYLASVAPTELRQQLLDWLARRWQLTPTLLHSEGSAFGLSNGYRDPAQLGVDRWLAMVGAWTRRPGPWCVVDCGTAATVDAIDAAGQHRGGFILPGIAMARRALLQHTAIPRVEDVADAVAFGTDTAAAVALGGRLAIVGAIEHAVRTLAQGGAQPGLLLTGSEAEQLAPHLQLPYGLAPDLVFEGMARYAAVDS